MSNEIIAVFLAISILLYCLLAGADFGAGILELFRGSQMRSEQTELSTHAMGPVWEANHMWLVLAIVILFNGYPRAYAALSVTYHIPLTLMLLGIVLRGCTFTFRHYDPLKGRSQDYYARAFAFASVLAPFSLGTIAGGMLLGRLATDGGYFENFIAPWCNAFCFSIGLFTCILFAFLAAVYLTGETRNPELREIFIRRARTLNIAAVFAGGLVFLSSAGSRLGLASLFLHEPISAGCILLATASLLPLWRALRKTKGVPAYFFAAAQVALILIGWFKLQFPMLLANGTITIYNSSAPEATLHYLLYALVIGSVFIFPALIYLMKIFKFQRA